MPVEMPVAVARFPADLALRRQLWRQWVRIDTPQGEHGRAMPTRARATRDRQILLPKVGVKREPTLRLIRQSVRPAPRRSVAWLVARCVALEGIVVVGLAFWMRS